VGMGFGRPSTWFATTTLRSWFADFPRDDSGILVPRPGSA
jgi:hypothetical protein